MHLPHTPKPRATSGTRQEYGVTLPPQAQARGGRSPSPSLSFLFRRGRLHCRDHPAAGGSVPGPPPLPKPPTAGGSMPGAFLCPVTPPQPADRPGRRQQSRRGPHPVIRLSRSQTRPEAIRRFSGLCSNLVTWRRVQRHAAALQSDPLPNGWRGSGRRLRTGDPATPAARLCRGAMSASPKSVFCLLFDATKRRGHAAA